MRRKQESAIEWQISQTKIQEEVDLPMQEASKQEGESKANLMLPDKLEGEAITGYEKEERGSLRRKQELDIVANRTAVM